MPTPVIAATAKKSHKSKDKIEGYWDDAKKQAAKKFKKKDSHYWSYVNAIVQRRAGLREELSSKMSFKTYLKLDKEQNLDS